MVRLVDVVKDNHLYIIPKWYLWSAALWVFGFSLFLTLLFVSILSPIFTMNPFINIMCLLGCLQMFVVTLSAMHEYVQVLKGKKTWDGKKVAQEDNNGAG